MSDVLVKVENVSKKFCKNLKYLMYYGVQDIGKNMLGILPKTDELRPGEFWSVNNVSFELKRGECLGLIGSNGAGKSTLLKILNGILSPDKGRIEIRGKVGALIDVSAGFHPMLTGRENIYVNGSILGFSKKEIDRKFDDIVEFSELGDFIDAPVKHYSSGMFVRLGFAIAAQMEPDVLLIDEVLAVGDMGFKIKCLNAIDKMSRNAAIVFVSHTMPMVARISSNIIVMNRGKIEFQGKDVSTGIEFYYSQFESEKSVISGSGKAKIVNISLYSNNEKKQVNQPLTIKYLDDLFIELSFSLKNQIESPKIVIFIYDNELRPVAQCHSYASDFKVNSCANLAKVRLKLSKIQLKSGVYLISIVILDKERKEILIRHDYIKKFQVVNSIVGWAPFQLNGEWSNVEDDYISDGIMET